MTEHSLQTCTNEVQANDSALSGLYLYFLHFHSLRTNSGPYLSKRCSKNEGIYCTNGYKPCIHDLCYSQAYTFQVLILADCISTAPDLFISKSYIGGWYTNSRIYCTNKWLVSNQTSLRDCCREVHVRTMEYGVQTSTKYVQMLL